MMDDDVFRADCCKAVAAVIADAFREACDERLELETGPLVENELLSIPKPQKMPHDDQIREFEIEMIGDVTPQILRHCLAALHMDDRAAAAAFEQRLKQPHQIFRFFFYFHLTVADDAKEPGVDEVVARKQFVEIKADHPF